MTVRPRFAVFVIVCLIAAALLSSPAFSDVMRFTMDPATTEIAASVADPMHPIRGEATGSFQLIHGEISGDPTSIAATGKVSVVIDANSYHSDSASRDKTVKTKALQSDQFATITFESSGLDEITSNSDTSGAADLLGNLTLHGTTHPVRIPVYASIDGTGKLIGDGEITFKYQDYGVIKPTALFGMLKAGELVTIKLHVVANPVNASAQGSVPAPKEAAPPAPPPP